MEANQKESEDILLTFLHEHIFGPLEDQQKQKLARIEKGIDDAVTENKYVQDISKKLDSLINEHNTIKKVLGENHSSLISEFQTNTSTAINILGESLAQFESKEKTRQDAIMQLVEQKSSTMLDEVKIGKDHVVETLSTKFLEINEKVSSKLSEESEKVTSKISEQTAQLSEKSTNGFSDLSEKLATQKEDQITSLQTQDKLIEATAESTKEFLNQQYQQMFGFQKKHSQIILLLLIAQLVQLGLIIYMLIG